MSLIQQDSILQESTQQDVAQQGFITELDNVTLLTLHQDIAVSAAQLALELQQPVIALPQQGAGQDKGGKKADVFGAKRGAGRHGCRHGQIDLDRRGCGCGGGGRGFAAGKDQTQGRSAQQCSTNRGGG